MSENELVSQKFPEGNLPPAPKELPPFFTEQQSKTKTFIPPVPPQLNPIIPEQPGIGHFASTPLSPPEMKQLELTEFEQSAVLIPSPSSAPPVTPALTSMLPAVSIPPATVPANASTFPSFYTTNLEPTLPPPPSTSLTVSSSDVIPNQKDEVIMPNIAPINAPAMEAAVFMPHHQQQTGLSAPPPPPLPPSAEAMIAMNIPESSFPESGIDENAGTGVLHWFQQTVKHSEFLSKVANKAKSGMDTVLTTLDPGMRGFLGTDDGDMHVIMLPTSSRIDDAVKHGIRQIFSEVVFHETNSESEPTNYQIVGHNLAWKKAHERLSNSRSVNNIDQEITMIVIQPFLFQINDQWFDTALLLIQKSDIEVSVFTQATQVDAEVVAILQKNTPKEYANELFTTTIGYAYAELYGGDPEDWQQNHLSFSSTELYRAASIALAANFKRLIAVKSSKP